MTRFGFSIRARGGQKVENIVIMASDGAQAERRLRQMYVQCEIVNRSETASAGRRAPQDVDGLINLFARHGSAHKSGTQ